MRNGKAGKEQREREVKFKKVKTGIFSFYSFTKLSLECSKGKSNGSLSEDRTLASVHFLFCDRHFLCILATPMLCGIFFLNISTFITKLFPSTSFYLFMKFIINIIYSPLMSSAVSIQLTQVIYRSFLSSCLSFQDFILVLLLMLYILSSWTFSNPK